MFTSNVRSATLSTGLKLHELQLLNDTQASRPER